MNAAPPRASERDRQAGRRWWLVVGMAAFQIAAITITAAVTYTMTRENESAPTTPTSIALSLNPWMGPVT